MVDWAGVYGMGEECGDPDLEHHDPAGHCGVGFSLKGGYGAAPSYKGGYGHFERERCDSGVRTCRRCGQGGLHWEVKYWDPQGREVWRLFDVNDELHECNTAASADDFEDVS